MLKLNEEEKGENFDKTKEIYTQIWSSPDRAFYFRDPTFLKFWEKTNKIIKVFKNKDNIDY